MVIQIVVDRCRGFKALRCCYCTIISTMSRRFQSKDEWILGKGIKVNYYNIILSH